MNILSYYDFCVAYHNSALISNQVIDKFDEIYALFKEYPFNQYVDCYGHSLGIVIWRNHDLDIKELSLKYPEVIFTLHAIPQEQYYFPWKKFYFNGKMQQVFPEDHIKTDQGYVYTVWPKFDQNKLMDI